MTYESSDFLKSKVSKFILQVKDSLYKNDLKTVIDELEKYTDGRRDPVFKAVLEVIFKSMPEALKYMGKSIKQELFSKTNFLTNLYIPDNIKEIEEDAFANSSLSSVDLGSVSVIGVSAFKETKLKEIVIPSGTELHKGAFSFCHNLEEIKFESPADAIIPKQCFYANNSLKKIDFGEGIKVIGEKAFYYCEGLRKVTIPDTVEKIDLEAFNLCENLEITLPRTLNMRNVDPTAFAEAKKIIMPRCLANSEGHQQVIGNVEWVD